jgi:uncharacterized protein with HEPN domain
MPDGRQLGYLSDIIESARLIQEYVLHTTEQQYYANTMIQDAVARRFEIIGEASVRLGAEIHAQIPEVPWRLIVGMRNRLIHEYDNIHTDVIWQSTQTDLMPLISALEPWIQGRGRIGENF